MPRESAARSAERRVHAEPAPKEEKGSQRSATATITPDSKSGLMDLEFLRGLIEALDQSGIDWLEIARAGTRIRMSKTPPPAPIVDGTARMVTAAAPAAAAGTPAAPAAAPSAETGAPVAAASKKNLVDVKSPMVGTFYCAPAPEAPPYVEIGTSVRKGQTLCILEAMKLMNELESEVDGVVREILAENADPVEYGQVLFRIEPAGSA